MEGNKHTHTHTHPHAHAHTHTRDITNVLESFGNDLKQLKENTSKRIEKVETLFIVSLNTYERNI